MFFVVVVVVFSFFEPVKQKGTVGAQVPLQTNWYRGLRISPTFTLFDLFRGHSKVNNLEEIENFELIFLWGTYLFDKPERSSNAAL